MIQFNPGDVWTYGDGPAPAPPPGGTPGVPGRGQGRGRMHRGWMCIAFLLLTGCTEITHAGTDYCTRWIWETATPPDTTWSINGVEVSRETFEHLCTSANT